MKLRAVLEARHHSNVLKPIPPNWERPEWFVDMTHSHYYYDVQLPESYSAYLYTFRDLFSKLHWHTELYEETYNDQMDYELDGPLEPDEGHVEDIVEELDQKQVKQASSRPEWEFVVKWVIARLEPE